MVLLGQNMTKNKSIRIAGRRSEVLKEARSRMLVVMIGLSVLYILLLARVTDLSLLQGALQRYADKGTAIEHIEENISPESPARLRRADIVDRNGVLLATTLEMSSLYADPALLPDVRAVARDVVSALPDLSYGDVLQKLQQKRRFVWIKRNLTPDEQYEILKLGYPGLKFRTEPRRIYPHGSLFAHIVGYTNIDTKGLAGLERSFDGLLSGGEDDLVTTLDVRIQHIMYQELLEAMTRFSGIGASGIIMDAVNGEILAAVSLPDFNPHDPGAASAAQLFNRISLGAYELGSVLKIFSTAAFIEAKNADMGHRFDARKPIKRYGFKISDYHAQKRFLTLPEVFIHSSNIGSALMGEQVGTEKLKKFYSDLGLFEPAPVEINEVAAPLLPQKWREINTLTASYGHGLAVSPLQLTRAVATVVNGGLLVNPTLVREKIAVNATKLPEKKPDVRVLSPQTAHRMRQLLRLAVTDGTGGAADVSGYRVGGKTGTADKQAKNGKGYDHKRRISSFVAAFPMDEPRYVVFVMVDEPKGTVESFNYATAGWVAAPAVSRVIARMAPLLGVAPVQESQSGDVAVSLKKYIRNEDDMGARKHNASQ